MIPTWLSKLLLIASILTAIIVPLAGIKPVYGIIATGIAGLITAFSDGFKSFVVSRGWTIAGALLVAGTVIGYIVSPDSAAVFGFIGANKLALVAQIGVILTTIGEKIQGGDSGGIGPNPAARFTSLFLAVLLIPAFSSGCDWKKAERPLVSAGYNFQISILAASQTTGAIHLYKPGAITNDSARSLFTALQKTSEIGQGFSQKIDQTIEVNPQTKGQLIAEADRFLGQVDATIALVNPSETKLRNAILVIRELAAAFKISIAAIEVATPTQKVLADVTKAKSTAVTSGTRDINDTVALINALGIVSADFTANVLAQKGLDAAGLRSQRDVKFQAVQSYLSAELAKL